MVYEVQLQNFQGPLDLLLFFIKRDEIDIMDIPIAKITKEYLDYLEAFQTLNVAIAGEFIVMAATLMRIKAKLLLPQLHIDDEEEYEDPRTELVQQLLEYKRYKEVSEKLGMMMRREGKKFSRATTLDQIGLAEEPHYYLEDVSLLNLVQVFKHLIENLPPPMEFQTSREEIHIKQQISYILTKFIGKDHITFSEIYPSFQSRQELITAFLAILEMIKSRQIHVLQRGLFGEIILERIEA